MWIDESSWPDRPDPLKPFHLRHKLADHPLLQIDQLLELSQRLPQSSIQYNLGDLPAMIDRRKVQANGLSPQETIAQIEECNSWMVLKHVQQDPLYKALLDEVLDQVEAGFGKAMAGMHQREGYIFVTSPRSVTPLHMDPEHNVLWQIHGWKEIRQWDPTSREYLPDRLLEDFYTAENHSDIQLEPIEAEAMEFRLDPGMGLHFPLECPHWVQNGDEVSISFSTTWQTRHSHRKSSIHQMNAKLRRLGWRPGPFGRSRVADGFKAGLMSNARRMKRLVGRSGR